MAKPTEYPKELASFANVRTAAPLGAPRSLILELVAMMKALRSSFAIIAVALTFAAFNGTALADTVQYFHDPVGRLSTVIDPARGNVQYIYDAVGNITSVNTTAVGAVVVGQVSPGRAAPGKVVTISGAGFGTLANTTVTFNGVAATPTAVTSTQITVAVPATATSGPVRVVTPGGAAVMPFDFKVDPSAVAPTITGFSPTTVAVGGTVTIQGTGFDALASNNKVSVNGQFVDLKSAASGTLVIGPMQFVGSGRISVSTPGGGAVSSSYLAVPPPPLTVADLSQAVAAPLGAAKTVSINKAGQNAIAMFDLAAPGTIAVRKTGTSTIDANIFLLDPAGTRLASTGTSSTLAIVPIFLSAPGTYTLLIDPNDSTATGTFQFTPFLVPPDASANVVANGPAVSLTTTTYGQGASYLFSATAGQRFSVLAQGDANLSNPCFLLIVVSEDDVTELYRELHCGAQGFSDVFVAPEAGTYAIKVYLYDYMVGASSVRLYGVPADAAATVLANGSQRSLTTTAPGQNMYLTFAAAANQRLSVLAQTDSSITNKCYDLWILKPDGEPLFSSTANCGAQAFSELQVAPVSGTYKVFLNPRGVATGRADFNVYTVPPDATGSISINGASASLTTTAPGQDMNVTFSAAAKQKINLSVTPDNNLSNSCFYVTIVNPDQTKLYGDLSCGNFNTGLLTTPLAGTYNIYFHPGRGGTGNAIFKVTSSGSAIASISTPEASSPRLTVSEPSRAAKTTFQGAAGQRLGLLVQADSTLGAQCFTTTVTGPDGATQLHRNLSCSGADFFVIPSQPTVPTDPAPALTQSGTYSLLLEPSGQAKGSASLTLYTVPADLTGRMELGGAAVNLTTTAPGQGARVSFSGAANQEVMVNLGFSKQTPSKACFAVTVLEPDGKTVLKGSLACGDSYSTGALKLPASGQYTVVAAPSGTMIATTSMKLVLP